jgi:hypothetical protein
LPDSHHSCLSAAATAATTAAATGAIDAANTEAAAIATTGTAAEETALVTEFATARMQTAKRPTDTTKCPICEAAAVLINVLPSSKMKE